MKRLFVWILILALVFGCVPVPVLAEENTEPSATTKATESPAEESATESIPVTIAGISVSELPTKMIYKVGESLDLTGGEVSVSFSNGMMQTVGMTAEMVSGFNNTAAFTQTLTVAYEGFETYFDVTVIESDSSDETEPTQSTEETANTTEPSGTAYVVPASVKEVIWVELVSKPTKIQYILNQDELDVTGGVLKILYSDGTEELIDITTDMVSGFNNTYVHTTYLDIEYGGHTWIYEIAIVESADKPLVMEYIIDMGDSKTTYYQYESLELNGVTLTLEYSNGTIETIDVTSDMVTDFDTSTTGYHSFNINYNGESYWQNYYVITSDMLSGTCGDNAFWEISESGVLTISGSGEVVTRRPEGWLDIPWKGRESLIKSVVIQNGITKIGDGSFWDCYRLTSVSLPTTLKEIGSQAFGRCTSLSTVTLPEGLTEIGYGAFYECTRLTTINFPQSLTDINHEAFYGCTGLTEIEFPECLDFLGSKAFANCTNLIKVTFTGKESPSGRGSDIFNNVTATGYYPGTSYWNTSFFDSCGGNVEWIAVGEVAESIKFSSDYYECNLDSNGISLNITSIPGYVGIDCTFTVDNNVVKVEKTKYGYYLARPQKEGTAIVTATDKRSGCTATTTIKVVAAKTISCPYEEQIESETYFVTRQYEFTPTESGKYVLSGMSKDETERCSFNCIVTCSDDSGTQHIESTIVNANNCYRFGYTLEAGKTYQITVECYSQVPNLNGKVTGIVSLKKTTDVMGIEIIGGDREVYGAYGETFYLYRSIEAKLLPENAVESIVWESSNPELISVYRDGNDTGLKVQGEGSATITARYGEYSDSITVTTKKPQPIFLNDSLTQSLSPNESYYFSFTPEETGRYVFEVDTNIEYGEHWFGGKYYPEDTEYGQYGSTNLTYGTFTAGVTYYYFATGYGYESENYTSTITVKKVEAKPVGMEIAGQYAGDTYMSFSVGFIPSNSYDEIVSWESSNPSIMASRNYNSGTDESFNIYGSGEVTITAVSKSGLRASCTVTVGQCYNGHTYGAWQQTKAKTCTIDGQETATCICGLRKYQPIPATGHNYDDNCDAACNDCGVTRAVEHDFGGNWLYSETAHWHNCTICGEQSDIRNHIPGAAATQETPQTCTECGYVIKGVLGHSHSYGTELTIDEVGHWYACSGCSARKNYNAHSYTNVCDADCNDCGFTRKNIHVSGGTWVSDKAGHWQSCTKCNTKLDYAAHVPGALATPTTPQICSVCRYEIQKATGTSTTITQTVVQEVTQTNHTHKYSDMLTLDEVGHWYACSGCTSKKEYAKHKFVNDCDADCDTCGYTRAVSHATDAKWSADGTGHWYACKNCGEKTSFAYHQQENGTCLICKQSMVDAQIPALGDTTETPSVVPNSNTTSAPSVPESGGPTINTTETVFSQEESAGLPWVALVITSVVSSIATLSVVVILVWLNRKKLIMLLVNN